MARRKTLLVLIILGLMALFLSPWTAAPLPEPEPSSPPEQPYEPLSVTAAAEEESPADLSIAAVIDQAGFNQLRSQSGEYQTRHPDVSVRWTRIDPASATLAGDIQAGIEASDMALVPNEWVRDLAVSGELQPVDSAFNGDALSEQFGAVIAQMKWNGYLWGVPRGLDPYVLLWNKNVLSLLQSDTAAFAPPLSLEQWEVLPQLMAEKGLIASWLAIDSADPLAILAWLGEATGQGQDELLDRSSDIWSSDAFDRALNLLDEQRAGIADSRGNADFWDAFAAGQYAAAIAKGSAAKQALADLPVAARSGIAIDRSIWETSFVWPNGTSFVLSSHSEQEEAAMRWVAEMTASGSQLDNYEEEGLLPVSRSIYGRLAGDEGILASSAASLFPNQAPLAAEPGLPIRIARLGAMWSDWYQGRLPTGEWKERWLGSLADTKPYN
ncbi:extracellular solute-binding protein [Cohnella lubricantis]|uniref:Extracellular solute-binding protein n=1 Tax=Cohnella lubricantis TaxID=2163172 RepID=A0A841TIF0_9BACL|nr:extracellular solute-binding protein [Cohnella lubricantis]MBB6678707.1 extracellular solute-binding protein [Cohnella lubricantis]MBP2119776.1 ABC-type glycerol-3-phosphate transport system substrate-binding protein [Cohnella lubricantis]